jgi:phosphomannomutase
MPALHPGRDALLGMALVVSLLARADVPISEFDAALPRYYAAKKTLPKPPDWARRLKRFAAHYIQEHQDDRDGMKVLLGDASIHVRPSNTEPIVRVVAEAKTVTRARALMHEAVRVLGFRM